MKQLLLSSYLRYVSIITTKIDGEWVFFQINHQDIIYFRLECLFTMIKWCSLETEVVEWCNLAKGLALWKSMQIGALTILFMRKNDI